MLEKLNKSELLEVIGVWSGSIDEMIKSEKSLVTQEAKSIIYKRINERIQIKEKLLNIFKNN